MCSYSSVTQVHVDVLCVWSRYMHTCVHVRVIACSYMMILPLLCPQFLVSSPLRPSQEGTPSRTLPSPPPDPPLPLPWMQRSPAHRRCLPRKSPKYSPTPPSGKVSNIVRLDSELYMSMQCSIRSRTVAVATIYQ